MSNQPELVDAILAVDHRVATLTLNRDDVRNELTGTKLVDDIERTVAWINQASPWLRWGVLPVVLFMVLFFEGMRRLLGVTMQSSMRQLKTQIRTLETSLAEVQATAKDQPCLPPDPFAF